MAHCALYAISQVKFIYFLSQRSIFRSQNKEAGAVVDLKQCKDWNNKLGGILLHISLYAISAYNAGAPFKENYDDGPCQVMCHTTNVVKMDCCCETVYSPR